MKKLFTLLVILASSSLLFAQHNYEDVVYLKNGSIIRGIIVEQVPNQSIKIETADRNIFVYRFDEIEKLSKELIQGKTSSGYYGNSLSREPGYVGILDVGYAIGIGVGRYGLDCINLTMINGYRFNPYFSLGFGTGARVYHAADAILIPFFANLQANFINRAVSPYFALNIGYSFNASDDLNSMGFLLNPSIGVHFRTSNKFGINISIGYEGQWATLYDGYYDYYYDYSYITTSSKSLDGISFKVGFVF
jgi:hypothetical protein